MEEGIYPGETCNRDGCKGIIREREKDGGCYCHLSAPCGSCCQDYTYCDSCDYEPIQP